MAAAPRDAPMPRSLFRSSPADRDVARLSRILFANKIARYVPWRLARSSEAGCGSRGWAGWRRAPAPTGVGVQAVQVMAMATLDRFERWDLPVPRVVRQLRPIDAAALPASPPFVGTRRNISGRSVFAGDRPCPRAFEFGAKIDFQDYSRRG